MSLAVHDLPLFMTAALLLNVTPGPDMLFVLGTSAAQGRRAGVMSALGVGGGGLVHVLLAAAGLSALLAASTLAFTLLKWAGAAYLIWIGVSMLHSRDAAKAAWVAPSVAARSPRVFWQGALTAALNPKVALFFLAFLPQFIEPAAAGQAIAFVVLGLLFCAGGIAVNVLMALLTSRLSRSLAAAGHGHRLAPWLRRAAGGLFVGLGLKLAFSSK